VAQPGPGRATLIAAGLAISGVVLTTNGAEYLRVAKKDAFDSVLALNQARAVSYDANADESRYLVDPGGPTVREGVPDQDPAAGDPGRRDTVHLRQTLRRGAARIPAGQHRHRVARATTAPSSATSPSSANAAAEQTLKRYQVYQVDDRRIRRLATTGQLRAAIAFCTSYNPGDSNYHFDRVRQGAVGLDRHQRGLVRAEHRRRPRQLPGGRSSRRWPASLILGLLLLGVRGRLAEYH
jgi:hypothetical protein